MTKKVRTPWGTADNSREVAEGVTWHSTPSHGGFQLSRQRMTTVRNKFPGLETFAGGPWFEEDCDWCFVALTFPELFKSQDLKAAESTLRNNSPKHWEHIYGRELQPGESSTKDRERFEAENANNLCVVSASGDWKKGVPKGMVEVTVTIGRQRDLSKARKFLVPQEDYDTRKTYYAFVVDPCKYIEVA